MQVPDLDALRTFMAQGMASEDGTEDLHPALPQPPTLQRYLEAMTGRGLHDPMHCVPWARGGL